MILIRDKDGWIPLALFILIVIGAIGLHQWFNDRHERHEIEMKALQKPGIHDVRSSR